MKKANTGLYLLGYKAVFCNCGEFQYVVDRKGQFVDNLMHPCFFEEIVTLDRFETRGGLVERTYNGYIYTFDE